MGKFVRFIHMTGVAALLVAAPMFLGCEDENADNAAEDASASTETSSESSTNAGGVASNATSSTAQDGSSSTNSGSTQYGNRVADFKALYGKDDAWETWMLANSARYAAACSASGARPGTVIISFRYETRPLAYSPAWSSEAEHMGQLAAMAAGVYPGYGFSFEFNGNTSSSYANIIAGTAGTTSYASGKNVYLYYETIFNHEFAHVMQIPHHYDSAGTVGNGSHMPPGETKCIMDRNSTVFCSACSTALGIPLNASDAAAADAAMGNILSRYPPAGARLVEDAAEDPPEESGSCGFIYGMCPADP